MYVKIRKSTLILRSVLFALLILGLCGAVLGMDGLRSGDRSRYEGEVAAGWRLSVAELSDALQRMETDLQKGTFASGEYQAVSWAAQVFAEAGAARTALEELPLYESRLENTETFLNQVGEFTLEMARKQMRGETLEEEEKQSLKTLALRSRQLADEVLSLSESVADENPDFAAMQELLSPSEEGEDPSRFEALEGIFAEDEPLIYDGDYSAWYGQRTSSWLESLPEADGNTFAPRVGEILGISAESLKTSEPYGKPFPYRICESENAVAALSVRGGILFALEIDRVPTESKLSVDLTLSNGTKALEKLGFPAMEVLAWRREENILSAVFVPRQQGVLIYGDRVTVSFALDNGEILALNATEYLLSHNPDRAFTPSVTAKEASAILREGLQVTDTDLAALAGGDGTEVLCWQFTVSDGDGQAVIFVDAKTKTEREILLLLQDEDFLRLI
ncbi:MAG: germination protein YpeB [Clostridia bacterium]|nr:germination protein YpeB [Clostridia bacterium]